MATNQFNLNQNDSFTDEDLGLGMLSNAGSDNGLDQLSDSESNDGEFGNREQFNSMNIPKKSVDVDAQSTFSAAESEKSVSSYAGSDLTPEEEIKKKKMLLFKLKRLQKRGYNLSRAYNIDSDLEDIQAEVDTIKREANLEQGTKVAKNMLISISSLLEYANNRFDPFDIVLDGWSEEINEDVENGEYDEVMEELYDKYYDKVSMSPEMKLLAMVGGSAVKFHLSHTLLKQMVGPAGANNLLKQNPNLKNEIQNAVNKTEMGQQFNNQMNNLHQGNVGGLTARKEMAGPTDVDDILAELENEDMNTSMSNNIMQDAQQAQNGVVTIDF